MELRQALDDHRDLRIAWVMAAGQWNARSLRFIDEYGIRDRVLFLSDPDSRAIDALGIRKHDPESIEEGVPHPTTILLDRTGRIRMLDVRTDYHEWLDPQTIVRALDRSAGSSDGG